MTYTRAHLCARDCLLQTDRRPSCHSRSDDISVIRPEAHVSTHWHSSGWEQRRRLERVCDPDVIYALRNRCDEVTKRKCQSTDIAPVGSSVGDSNGRMTQQSFAR